jgi:sugar phosphate isomerase/epimerase
MELSSKIGIMQGRLSNKPGKQLQSFPWDSWKDEFANAASLGFETLEWLVDGTEDLVNPISSVQGRAQIRSLCERHRIKVKSLCAHTFIDGHLLSASTKSNQSISLLRYLLDWANLLSIEIVILPVMAAMSLRTDFARERLANVLNAVLDTDGPAILLEADLPGTSLLDFVNSVGSNRLGVLYDLGNANALGFDLESDLRKLSAIIYEIHMKDRDLDTGISQRLGRGQTPLRKAAQVLSLIGWKGLVVLETPIFDDWREEAKHNLAFTRDWLTVVEGNR